MMLTLKIITPQKELLSAQVSLVELPGAQGRFEVLQDHAPLISSLDAGTIRYIQDNEEHRIETQPGFVEVRDNVVTVCIG
jgi:F-type H+-transporting ATPase subunit epsilon